MGSLHCLGMCGPLNLLILSRQRSWSRFALYHTGRIGVYVLLGVGLGIIGYSIRLFHLQLLFTFGLGIALMVLYSFQGMRLRLERWYYQSAFYQWLQRYLIRNLSQQKQWFASGLANGFLPCGLTYVAAAGAIAMNSLTDSVLYMILFGLGTMPALAFLGLGLVSSVRIKKMIPKSIPLIAWLSGSLLVLRGFLIALPDFNQLVHSKAAGLITICGL